MSPSTDVPENCEFASELKFVAGPAKAEQIRNWASTRLLPDPNASDGAIDTYQITSLYFDTKHFDAFHRRGSFGRSKYRIRRYGANQDAFLERKLKTRGLLSKRRSLVKLDELKRLGGLYQKAANWVPFVITDGRLLTGQNPASSKAGAEALLKLLA